MDEHFLHLFTCVVAGQTSCGKTEFVAKFIQHAKEMVTPCTNSSRLSNCPSGDACVLRQARHVQSSRFQSRSNFGDVLCAYAFHVPPLSAAAAWSAFALFCQVCTISISILVCRYAPIFVFSKATCNRFVSQTENYLRIKLDLSQLIVGTRV